MDNFEESVEARSLAGLDYRWTRSSDWVLFWGLFLTFLARRRASRRLLSRVGTAALALEIVSNPWLFRSVDGRRFDMDKPHCPGGHGTFSWLHLGGRLANDGCFSCAGWSGQRTEWIWVF